MVLSIATVAMEWFLFGALKQNGGSIISRLIFAPPLAVFNERRRAESHGNLGQDVQASAFRDRMHVLCYWQRQYVASPVCCFSDLFNLVWAKRVTQSYLPRVATH